MDDVAPVERQVRAAHNQALFRTVNERLKGLAEAFQFVAQTASFTCECADTSCIEQVNMSLDEYESVRADPNNFIVRPGHVDPDVEYVVSGNERLLVVAKVGVGAKIAEAFDPRHDPVE